MTQKFLLILILFTSTAFSQSVESIDNLVYEIEKTIFSDTITVLDSPRVDTKPIRVIAFLKDVSY